MADDVAELIQRLGLGRTDWPRLLSKVGEAMARDYGYSGQIAELKLPVLVVAGDADIFPPSHAVELFALLGGGLRDGGWDGSGKPISQLLILPGLTHYDIFASPALAAVVLPFLEGSVKAEASGRE